MKNQASKLRSIFTVAVLVCVLGINSTAVAADTKLEKSAPIEVQYVGQLDEKPVFQVNIDNEQGEEVYVRLEDEENNVLYSDKFSDKKFSKKFQFVNNELKNMNITMTLASKNERKTQVFQISNVTKVIQNVVVTKVK